MARAAPSKRSLGFSESARATNTLQAFSRFAFGLYSEDEKANQKSADESHLDGEEDVGKAIEEVVVRKCRAVVNRKTPGLPLSRVDNAHRASKQKMLIDRCAVDSPKDTRLTLLPNSAMAPQLPESRKSSDWLWLTSAVDGLPQPPQHRTFK